LQHDGADAEHLAQIERVADQRIGSALHQAARFRHDAERAAEEARGDHGHHIGDQADDHRGQVEDEIGRRTLQQHEHQRHADRGQSRHARQDVLGLGDRAQAEQRLDRQQDHEHPLRDARQHGDDHAAVELLEHGRVLRHFLAEAEHVAEQDERRINDDRAAHRPVVDPALIEPAAQIAERHGNELGRHAILPGRRGEELPGPLRSRRAWLLLSGSGLSAG
jgi:hypothetical protein